MSVLSLISQRAVKVTGGNLYDSALVDFFRGVETGSGVEVTEATSLQVATVFACIRVLSEDVAKLPLILYQRLDRGKRRMDAHPIYRLLHDAPNPEMTPFTFKSTIIASKLRTGNGYAEIQRNAAEVPAALWPLDSSRVRPMREEGTRALVYEVRDENGVNRTLQQRDVFHLPGLGGDGICGWSVVRMARETIGSAIARERFSGKFFANNAQGGGFLEHPGALTDKAYDRLQESIKERWQGTENAFKPKILEEGMKWHDSTLPAEDAQFLEMSQFTVEEICRWFRVPPHKAQHLLRATFNNIEHLSLEYVTDSLMSHLVGLEQECNRKLISLERSRELFAEHLLNALLRGDMAGRATFYGALFNIGALAPNDILELENMNPVEDGDTHYRPLNMIPLGEEPPPPAPPPTPPAEPADANADEEPDPQPARAAAIVNAHRPLLADVLTRLARIEGDRVKKCRGAKDEADQIRRFYDEHTLHVRAALHPALEALAGSLASVLGNGQALGSIIQATSDLYIAEQRSAALANTVLSVGAYANSMAQHIYFRMETDHEQA